MAEDYVVQRGDCLSNIAAARGFGWRTLWDHPRNAELKQRRKNPNILYPGDVVHIPDMRVDPEPCPTDQIHVFQLKGVPAKIRLVLTDDSDTPLPGLPYRLDLPDQNLTWTGNTDGDGALEHSVPPGAKKAVLTVEYPHTRVEYRVLIGGVDPVDTVSGAQGRLLGLGFYQGEISGETDQPTVSALLRFQVRHSLPPTGELDGDTKSNLEELFGC